MSRESRRENEYASLALLIYYQFSDLRVRLVHPSSRRDRCVVAVKKIQSPRWDRRSHPRSANNKVVVFRIDHLLRFYPRESAFISGQNLSAVFVFSQQSKS